MCFVINKVGLYVMKFGHSLTMPSLNRVQRYCFFYCYGTNKR